MGTTVIGTFPRYIHVSDQLGGRRFDIGTHAWSALGTKALKWRANAYFLDQMMKAGDAFVMSSDPQTARPGSWYFDELNYLRSKGHVLATHSIWVD